MVILSLLGGFYLGRASLFLMFNFDSTRLNPLEKNILETLRRHAKDHSSPTIVEAASICGCSTSQVSKTVRKAGFRGYKNFIRFLYFGELPIVKPSGELERLRQVIEEFDASLVDGFISLLEEHEKIVFFGYGPSLICAQYFEYKLRFCTDAFIVTPPDENSVRSLVDSATLLAIFTATGQYRSFAEISQYAKSRGAKVVLISEEFNSTLMDNCDRYMVLSHHKQPDKLLPYQKTRTVFFIFFEQVILRILENQKGSDDSNKPVKS